MANDRQQRDDAEPRVEDLGQRSFAGQNIAADQQRQARERGAGLGAGGTDNRAARHPDDRDVDTSKLPRDGNGDPLGGLTPEDDLD